MSYCAWLLFPAAQCSHLANVKGRVCSLLCERLYCSSDGWHGGVALASVKQRGIGGFGAFEGEGCDVIYAEFSSIWDECALYAV